jgi:transposase-like protein
VGKRSNIGRHAVHRSAAQGRALVEQWRQSGLSVSEFCRRQGVGAHVLRYWLLRDAKPGLTAATGDAFYVVSAPSAESTESAPASMGLGSRAGGAVVIVLPTTTSEQLVRTLRGLLEEVRA